MTTALTSKDWPTTAERPRQRLRHAPRATRHVDDYLIAQQAVPDGTVC
ncbi:hypothetical protein ACFVZW_00860 [Streptomyces sp. NPDC059567]